MPVCGLYVMCLNGGSGFIGSLILGGSSDSLASNATTGFCGSDANSMKSCILNSSITY